MRATASAAERLQAAKRVPRERHQEGWVEPVGKKVKKWRGHYFAYEKLPDGSEARRHRTADLGLRSEVKKWEAESALRRLITEKVGTGVARPSPRVSLKWFYEHRYLPLKESTWKASSREKTKEIITYYVLEHFGETTLAEMNRFSIQAHLNLLAANSSKSVCQKFRVYVKAILEEAVEQDYLTKNPARKLEMPETRTPSKRFLSEEEIIAILAAANGRDRLILRMFLVLGLRPGEMFALRRDDWVGRCQLRIDESASEEVASGIVDPKTHASMALVWLPESIAASLDAYMGTMEDQSPEALLFPSKRGTPMRVRNFLRRNVQRTAAKARKALKEKGVDLPAGFLEGINHQAFRRTCATALQHLGSVKDIQAHLRHASPDVTAQVYMQEVPESVRAAVEALDAKLLGKAE